MLAYQAAKAFEIWFGVMPEVNEETYGALGFTK
jgi:shikimate 5-dehydrogenase